MTEEEAIALMRDIPAGSCPKLLAPWPLSRH
jgi:hypothetical protein